MFGRESKGLPAEAIEPLAARIDQLEAQGRGLSEALAAREEELRQLKLSYQLLAKRLDETSAQSRKAVAGLLERIETLRRQPRLQERDPA